MTGFMIYRVETRIAIGSVGTRESAGTRLLVHEDFSIGHPDLLQFLTFDVMKFWQAAELA
jgi:hypothetical protein